MYKIISIILGLILAVFKILQPPLADLVSRISVPSALDHSCQLGFIESLVIGAF